MRLPNQLRPARSERWRAETFVPLKGALDISRTCEILEFPERQILEFPEWQILRNALKSSPYYVGFPLIA